MTQASVQPQFQYDAFVSYAEDDSMWVEGYLLDALQDSGLRCQHEAAFTLGVPRLLQFEQAVRESKATIIVLSPAYFASSISEFVDVLAATFGTESGLWPVIPLRLHECELPPRLRILEGLDAVAEDSWPKAVERLCRHLRRPPPPPSVPPQCPYPGMRPFSEEEHDLFFGREREVENLVQRLRLHPFIAVIGPSGSGKSSLVFAALLSALFRSRQFGAGTWAWRSVRPGTSPMPNLEARMGGGVRDAAAAVARVLAASPDADKLLLVVDQLEELFTSASVSRREFEDALIRLAQTPDCYVVTTMRADFYPQLMTSPLWELSRDHRVEVLPLKGEALRQAIERPAERVGVHLESGLVERLLADAAGEPGLLPLVQETLVCLWERVERRFLPLSAYHALMVSRAAYGEPEQTGLQVAMARRADDAVSKLVPEEQLLARRTFLRLVQFGQGRDDVRRQQLVSDLRSANDDDGMFERVLEHLANRRLVTITADAERPDERRVDLAHEALIRGWPTFQGWLRERREGEQTRRVLSTKAEEWIRLGQNHGGLLDAVELLEAERWIDSADAPELGVDRHVLDLVAASRSVIDRESREREEAQQRELAQARALAVEQRDRASEQALATRRARRLVGALALLVVFMVVASSLALVQRNRASEQATVARSRELAGQARSLADRRRDLALLLSVEAYRKSPTAEARASLREAVEQDPRVSRYLVGPAADDQFPSLANAVTYSPDGRILAAAGDDDIVVLWDTATGQVRGEPLVAHPGYEHPDDTLHDVRALGFSPDGRVLASASNDARIWLWDAETGARLGPPLGDGVDPVRHAMRAVAFHPKDPALLAAGSIDGTVVLWDVRSRRPARAALTAPAGVTDVAFSGDGRLVAAASDDGSVTVWDTGRDELLYAPVLAHGDRARSVAFSPDGSLVASSGNDGRVVILDAWTGRPSGEALTAHAGNSVYDVVFSPDGTRLASASSDLTARTWDVTTRQPDPLPLVHAASVNAVAFAPDGKTIATTSRDRTTVLWQLDRQAGTTLLAHHSGAANAVAMSPDGRFTASGGDDNVVLLVVEAGREVERLEGFGEAVTSVAFSPDGRFLAAGSWDSQVLVWEVASRRLALRLQDDPRDGVLSIAFRPDGLALAAGGAKGAVRLWDLGAGTVRAVLHGPDRPGPDGRLSRASIGVEPLVHDLEFTPDGKTLVAANEFGGVWRWSGDGSRPEGDRLTPWGQFVYAVGLTPDGRRVVSGGLDGAIAMWDVGGSAPQARSLREFKGQYRRITSLSVQGGRLASASDDGTIALWSLESGQLLEAPFKAGSEGIRAVAFSPDGKRLASSAGNGRVVSRNLDPDELVRRACDVANHDLLQADWRTYLGRETYHATCSRRAKLP